MELEEPEDDEWRWKSSCTNYNNKFYWSESDDGNGYNHDSSSNGGKGSWVLNLGKKVLVAGFVATSAPIFVPPLFIASAIGVVASVPYAFFLASHACTQTLMSRLLPIPHHHEYDMLLDEDVNGEEQFGTDGAENVIMNYEKNLISSDGGYEQRVMKVDESYSPDARHNVSEEGDQEIEEENLAGRMLDDGEVIGDEIDDGIGMEEGLSGEGNGEQPMSAGHGVVITIEGIDGNEVNDNDVVEEFKAPFDVTTVFVDQFGDKAIEGEIDEEELKRETTGLLEEIRDEGRTDDGGEYVNGIHGDITEDKQEIDPVVEYSTVACNTHSCKEEIGKEEVDKSLCEQKIPPRNTENKNNTYDCVESDDPIRNGLEDGEVDSTSVLQKSNDPIRVMLEGEEVVSTSVLQEQFGENSELLNVTSSQDETLPAEPVRDLVIDQNCNVPLVEESAEVIDGNIVLDMIVDEEPDQLLDEPTVSQGVKSDNNISASVNQEHQLPKYDEILDSSDEDSNEVSGENGFDLSDEKTFGAGADTCTIELHEESSVVMVNGHAAAALIEVTDYSVEKEQEQECRPSEIASGKDAMRRPYDEVLFNEESMWKQITVIRKIIGYEGSKQKSCIDELKALYIFTGVEFPAFVKENPYDPSEINEKLHFLMSIVGIKSNED